MNQVDIYNDISAYSEILGATSYRHIQMLLEKLNVLITQTISALENNNILQKCQLISKSNSIVLYLNECLNFSADREIAAKLNSIYTHLERQLFLANAKNQVAPLLECQEIISNLLTWWNHANNE